MGLGDQYVSHHFETILKYALLNLLKKMFPEFDSHISGFISLCTTNW